MEPFGEQDTQGGDPAMVFDDHLRAEVERLAGGEEFPVYQWFMKPC
jgi:hypothetical protein